MWTKLLHIDLNKDKYVIIQNPESYFNEYLSEADDEAIKTSMQLTIFLHLCKLFSCFTDSQSIPTCIGIFKSEVKYLTAYRDFLIYTLALLNIILDKQENAFLDTYSNKGINVKSLKKVMLAFGNKKEMFKKYKIDIEERIKEVESELQEK